MLRADPCSELMPVKRDESTSPTVVHPPASSAVAGDELFLRGAGPSPAGDGTHEQANRPDSWAETAGLP